ncbi:MAG TPA: TrkH family potassium uptake protein [Longimicrobiaceae bacterium]|nr:TrkH family potassium uptake protein [Longimicrobiaceae bacterium]
MTPQRRSWIDDWEVRRRRRSLWHELTGPQLFAGSFALLVLGGTLGLRLLPGLYTGPELGWLDALFTSVSAVCVTGLVVVDTATYFTPAGQAFLLLLIQLGGLGIVTFTSLIIIALGRRLSLRHLALSGSAPEVAPHVEPRALARDVVRFTFTIEAAGALLLYALWVPRFGWGSAAWPALFHSVSAFCNAGFSVFSDSMVGFQRSPLTLLVIAALVVAGGIGFLTLEELHLFRTARREGRQLRISLHSRIVIATTALLLAGGWLGFAFFEWHITLAGLPWWDRAANALFLSVMPRTAGFNNVDYAQATDATNFLTIILMFIGGSPGSTAGGLKTTTFALVGLLAWSRFRGREVTSLWGRSIPEETIQRAVGLAVVAFALVTLSIFAYTATELSGTSHAQSEGGFIRYMFEAVSAFNTVGLSMGVTAGLSEAGKLLTILLMYLGRVGPLTFAAALALRAPTPAGEFRYAYEEVVVG